MPRSIAILLASMIPIVQATALRAQDAEAQIRDVERQWAQAALHADTAVMGRLLADDFIVIRTDGALETRESRLRAFGSGSIRTQVLDLSELRIRVNGAVAIVTGLATRRDSVDHRPRDFQYRYTRIWMLQQGRWRCVEMQATPVSSCAPGPACERR